MLAIVGVGLAIIGLGVTIAMDAKTKGEFRFAVGSFAVSGVMLASTIIMWALNADSTMLRRMLISGALFAVLGISLVETVRWTYGRHIRASASNTASTPKNNVTSPLETTNQSPAAPRQVNDPRSHPEIIGSARERESPPEVFPDLSNETNQMLYDQLGLKNGEIISVFWNWDDDYQAQDRELGSYSRTLGASELAAMRKKTEKHNRDKTRQIKKDSRKMVVETVALWEECVKPQRIGIAATSYQADKNSQELFSRLKHNTYTLKDLITTSQLLKQIQNTMSLHVKDDK